MLSIFMWIKKNLDVPCSENEITSCNGRQERINNY